MVLKKYVVLKSYQIPDRNDNPIGWTVPAVCEIFDSSRQAHDHLKKIRPGLEMFQHVRLEVAVATINRVS